MSARAATAAPATCPRCACAWQPGRASDAARVRGHAEHPCRRCVQSGAIALLPSLPLRTLLASLPLHTHLATPHTTRHAPRRACAAKAASRASTASARCPATCPAAACPHCRRQCRRRAACPHCRRQCRRRRAACPHYRRQCRRRRAAFRQAPSPFPTAPRRVRRGLPPGLRRHAVGPQRTTRSSV
jgi:hypothetical protein